jgi:hypothetical protein
MTTALVTTPWVGSGTLRDPYRPRLHDDYPGLTWSDASGLAAATIALGGASGPVRVECSEATLASIQADPRYAGHITGVASV